MYKSSRNIRFELDLHAQYRIMKQKVVVLLTCHQDQRASANPVHAFLDLHLIRSLTLPGMIRIAIKQRQLHDILQTITIVF